MDWLKTIQEYDEKAKFIRENDEMIGAEQEQGKLKVLMVYSRGDNRGKYYFCQCKCGNFSGVWGSHFRTGHSKSCGCGEIENRKILAKNIINYDNSKDITGQKNGYLVALRRLDKKKSEQWIWECRCTNCGSLCEKTTTDFVRSVSCGCMKISVGEMTIQNILENNNILFEREKRFNTCRFPDTNAQGKFDFYLPDKNILIEYDGIQHFEENTFFTGSTNNSHEALSYTHNHDEYKNKWCIENNIILIRIPYTHLEKITIEDLLENSLFRIN